MSIKCKELDPPLTPRSCAARTAVRSFNQQWRRGRNAFFSVFDCSPLQRQFRCTSSSSLLLLFFGMAEQLDEESQMRAARAEIMAVSDMFHR